MDQLGKRLSIPEACLWAAGLILTALIVYLHITFLRHAGALWRDEINTIHMASMPSLSDIWASLHLDSFPILPTLVFRLWMKTGLGATDMGLRTFGFLVGLAILGALWLNARLLGHRVPVISLALFGLTSLLVRSGDAIRPYGIGLFFILLAFGLVWQVVVKPSCLRLVSATLAAVLGVQCLYTNAFVLLVILLASAIVTLRRKLWKRTILLIGIGAIAAISLLPYVKIVQRSGQWVELTYYSTTYEMLWNTLSKTTLGAASQYMPPIWAILIFLGFVVVIYRNIGPATGSGREADKTLCLAALIVITTIVFFVLYKSLHVYPFPRYFFIPLAIVAVAIDGLLWGRNSLWSLGRVALAVLVVAVTIKPVLGQVRVRQTNMDLVAAKLETMVSEKDLVIFSPWFYGIPLHRYYHGKGLLLSIPPIEDFSIHRYDLLKEMMASRSPLRPVFSSVERVLRGGGRVWLVGNIHLRPYNRMPPPPVLPPAPKSPFGWKSGPYITSWEMQTMYFISLRALYYNPEVIVPAESVNPFENARVIVAWGWREPGIR